MAATLIDSNVILDVIEPGSAWTDWAKARIAEARIEGPLVFNVVIAAEVAYGFHSKGQYAAVFDPAVWKLEDLPFDAGLLAGWAHREYRLRGGQRVCTLPDFLIGAHAVVAEHRLLTRDVSHYKTYFPSLEVISPESHP